MCSNRLVSASEAQIAYGNDFAHNLKYARQPVLSQGECQLFLVPILVLD